MDWKESIQGMVVADLDHDYQYRKETLPASPLPSTAPPDAPSSDPPRYVDTDVDLIVYGDAGLRLFKNELDKKLGKRTLVPMPISEEMSKLTQVQSVATIDFDHDSDLDLVVASKQGVTLWSNRGDWTFADFTPYSSLPPSSVVVASVLALDLDRNVLNDFLLGGDDLSKPIWLSNNLHGRYRVTDQNWKGNIEGACRAIQAIDANRDACWDLLSCGKYGTRLTLMSSPQNKNWGVDQVIELSKKPMSGLIVADWNNDGFQDAVAFGLQGMESYVGTQQGRLTNGIPVQTGTSSVRDAIALDTDRDGDEDLLCLSSDGQIRLIENSGGNTNQRVEVVIRADEDGQQRPRERCNMHGVGSLIELKAGSHYQSQIVRGTKTRFGLGQQSKVDVLRILWTNGIPNNVLDLKDQATVFDQQNLGGSCPYLYAWNGHEFAFVTDCLWAAPIGLQFAQGVSAPCREWEYLLIDSDRLKPRAGRYELQVTEELWEAAYFDSVQLIAIDHPKEVEVFTNEKVGPAELAQFKLHWVTQRKLPRAVHDQSGIDLLPVVSKRDQVFTRCWKEGFNQGLVEPHWIEVDMNDEGESTRSKTLFLTGWVFPTCTSLNLAMTENPLRPKLQPPSIQVPDEQGNWKEVIPYAGFPGGKTKTIAIEMADRFLCKDHRVRVVTNMELCWDEVFWAYAEEGAFEGRYRKTPLHLLSADLHYRGFSRLIPQPGNAPKRYEYKDPTRDSIWPPMSGAFTRFGDVRTLLESADDRQVVMGAGDEMTLTFSAEGLPLPSGWKRDFILYNIGWDKDADLNTIHGQSVEPLPFRSMSRYPYAPEESFPSTPLHLEYLQQYQTRYQDHGLFWNQIRDAQP